MLNTDAKFQKENFLHSLDESEYEMDDNSFIVSDSKYGNHKENLITSKSNYKNYFEHSSILDSLSSSSLTKTETEKKDLIYLTNFSKNMKPACRLLDSMNLSTSFKQLGRNYYKDLKTSDTSSDNSSSESFELDIEFIVN
jgi:hypothetical protein